MTSPQPPSASKYEAALATAAMMRTSLTPDEMIRRMAEAVAQRRESLADWAARSLEQLWAFADPYDPESMGRFTAKAAQVMHAAQTNVARSTAAAQRQQLAAVGVNINPVPSDPKNVRASKVTIVDGKAELERTTTAVVEYAKPANDAAATAEPEQVRPRARVTVSDTPPERPRSRVTVKVAESTEELLERPAKTYRYERSKGASHDAANDAAKSRVRVIVDDNLMLAQRLAEAESLAQAADLDDRVIGYRRIVHPELSRGGTCGMCLVAATRMYEIGELKAIHDRCWCTVAAVTKDHDPRNVNDADLKRFYADAQGTYRATLKRTRYQVDEHGEFAAVLVPKAEYRSNKQRAKDRAKAAEEKALAKRLQARIKQTSATGG